MHGVLCRLGLHAHYTHAISVHYSHATSVHYTHATSVHYTHATSVHYTYRDVLGGAVIIQELFSSDACSGL
jgi:hypothetical protein